MSANDKRSAVKKLRQLVFTQKSEIAAFREQIEKTFFLDYIPNNVEREEKNIGGVVCDVLTPEAAAQNRTMLYVHGGSFVGGSRVSWRSFCASLAHAASTTTIVPEFRLAPEHPFPAAFEDVAEVLDKLILSDGSIIIGADSSGASIALAAVINANEQIRKRIAAVMLFSPWLDLSPASPLFSAKKRADEIYSTESLRRCADIYTYHSNLTNPLVSPMYAKKEELINFPQIFFQLGSQELAVFDTKRFAENLKICNIPYIMDIWDGMMFMFQMADEFISEAHLAVERAGAFIKSLPYPRIVQTQ
ncbi:MAG: alpha/beta hydrolase [Bacteroides sp.]|nr:alpha/beta hydrolase [Prevotella sp.]MCM1407640.1 alpha/beta hydrolase [Treponema brennaborense]MCM1469210.1 alpha/beta hydrolase [Bacteroides sp.]